MWCVCGSWLPSSFVFIYKVEAGRKREEEAAGPSPKFVCFLASLFGLSDFHHLSWTPANRFSQHLFSFPVHVVVNFVNLSVLALEIETLVTLTSNPCENEAETLMSAGGIWSERAVNNLTSFLVELDLINAKK